MDRITATMLEEFVAKNELLALPEDRAFEHFCGLLAVAKHYDGTFSTSEVAVGEGGDCGIDCVAIIVNGSLVTEPEEIADLCETNGNLDATLVFVQAERSSSFDGAKIGTFGDGVVDFLSESPRMRQSSGLQERWAVVNELFARSSRFYPGNPRCFLYYVTTGTWTDDTNLIARREAVIDNLRQLRLLRDVVFDCLDADRVQRMYRDAQNAVKAEVVFSQCVELPELPGVERAFLGVLKAGEFLKLVENSDGEMRGSVFVDNVRYWQEWNAVNTEIRQTLESDRMRPYFVLFNNGVTVVARRLNPTRDRMLIEDYQVVNGCQTSFVLHEAWDRLSDDVLVPVRLIATEDTEIRDAIIKATNRQSQVTEVQLLALSDYQRKLENYFLTFQGRGQLFYERRPNQYCGDGKVERVRIVTPRDLVRAFAAIFMEQPHRTTRNFRALLSTVGDEIFNPAHRLEPYYVAAYAHYRLDFLFRNQVLPSDLRAARYHVLLAYRLLTVPAGLPPLNSRAAGRFCDGLMEGLWDDERCRALFLQAADIVREIAEGNMDRDHIRTEPFTDRLIARLRPNTPTPESAAAPDSA